MFSWLFNLLRGEKFKNNNIEVKVEAIHEATSKSDVAEAIETTSKDNLEEKEKQQEEEQQEEETKPSVTVVEEKDSIYKMFGSRVLSSTCEACYLTSYNIKGYTKYLSTEVAGAHHRSIELWSLFKIIKDRKLIGICAYCEKEPDNPYDVNAAKVMVKVKDKDNTIKTFHIGYLPKEVAKCFKDIDEIPLVITFIKYSKFKDVYIDVYAENAVYERAVEEEKRLLEIKNKYENNKAEINKLIDEGDVLEKDGFVEDAMDKFKRALDLYCVMPHPAHRLVIYYRRKTDYESEIAVISKFLKQNVYRIDWEYYEERLEKAKDLRRRQINRDMALIEKAKLKEEKEKQRKLKELEAKVIKKEAQVKIEQNKNSSLKVCSCCKQEKSLEHFNKNGKDANGNITYMGKCKECIRLQKSNVNSNNNNNNNNDDK